MALCLPQQQSANCSAKAAPHRGFLFRNRRTSLKILAGSSMRACIDSESWAIGSRCTTRPLNKHAGRIEAHSGELETGQLGFGADSRTKANASHLSLRLVDLHRVRLGKNSVPFDLEEQ